MSLDDYWPPVEPLDVIRAPKCRHPKDLRIKREGGWECGVEGCGHVATAARVRAGRQTRNYGNRAELSAARKYGGDKVGAAGGPVDIRGKDFNTQMKTHRRTPPREWTSVFTALEANRERIPRLLARFVMGSGVAPKDYFIFQAEDFLQWFGRDE